MKIIIPMNGSSLYEESEGFVYPKIITEVAGKTLLEHAISYFYDLDKNTKFIFLIPKSERRKLSLDAIIKIICPGKYEIIDLIGETAGALCTCLLTIDHLDPEEEIIISSADHYIHDNITHTIEYYRHNNADAGVITFDSVHPKWSYALLDNNNNVYQTAEKNPISSHALTGLFYFKNSFDFMTSARNVILKQNTINGNYFVSSAINEHILSGKSVIAKKIQASNYYNFYDNHSINVFENFITTHDSELAALSKNYISLINDKNYAAISILFNEDTEMQHLKKTLTGRVRITKYLEEKTKHAKIEITNLIADKDMSVIEFSWKLENRTFQGAHILTWENGKVSRLNTYTNEMDA